MEPPFFLLLLIEPTLIPISPQLYPWQPGRCPAHLLTNGVQGYAGTAVYDQFIMDVPDYAAVGQRPHGVGQDVPADGLYDVFHELRTVAFDAAPLLLRVNTHIGDGFAAEPVHADAGFDIGQPPAGRKCDEQHSVPSFEVYAADPLRGTHIDGGLDGLVYRPPVSGDVRVALPPQIDQRLKFILGQPHIQSAHRIDRTDGAAVAEGQLRNLTLLAQVAVDAVLLYRDAEHSAGALTIDVPALVKDLRPPPLTGKVRQHPRFDGGEIADDELAAGRGDESGAYQLGQDTGDGVIKHIQHFIVSGFYQIAGLFQIAHMILG